jgi:hypothetical protein
MRIRAASWGKALRKKSKGNFFSSCTINKEEYHVGDFVFLLSEHNTFYDAESYFIAAIRYLWEDRNGKMWMKGDWYVSVLRDFCPEAFRIITILTVWLVPM